MLYGERIAVYSEIHGMLRAVVYESQHITAVHSSITAFKTLEFRGGVYYLHSRLIPYTYQAP
jgi:hypothetical protein